MFWIYKIKIPIKNIEPLVKKLGGKIVYEDLGYKDSVLIKTGNESFLIKLNKKESFNINNRINALIAYELGHLILHMGYQRDRELWNKIETNQTIKTDFDENTDKNNHVNSELHTMLKHRCFLLQPLQRIVLFLKLKRLTQSPQA